TGFVEGDRLRLLLGVASACQLAQAALSERRSLADCAAARADVETLEYGPIHRGESEWRLLPSFDHPEEPARCLVTGTGLTHKKSVATRQAMHTQTNAPISDSMKMYQIGVEGGRPARGKIGGAPEWFYKGCGTILRAHGEPLD